MEQLPEEFHELQELVEHKKLELEEARRELEELGRELKRDYVQNIVKPRLEKLKANPGSRGQVNKMCARCLNSCKQPTSARIYNCPRFEPLEEGE